MEERNNLDQLFKDALYNYNVEPPRYVWDDIKTGLIKNKKEKRLRFIKYTSAAAAIVIAFVSGYLLTDYKNVPQGYLAGNNQIIIDENAKTNSDKNEIIANQIQENSSNHSTNNAVVVAFKNHKNDGKIQKADRKIEKDGIIDFIQAKKVNKITNNVVQIPAVIKGKDDILPLWNNFMISKPNAIITYDDDQFIEESDKFKRWSVGGKVSPTYTMNNSTTNQQLSQAFASDVPNNNNEKATVAFNGGLKVNYQILKRLSFESGFYYSKLGNQINDVRIDVNQLAYYEGGDLVSTNSYTTSSSLGEIRYNTNQENGSKSPKTVFTDTKLKQDFEYLEIPLYLKYKVIDKKIDMQLLCGFAPGLLVANKVYLENENQQQWIGYTEGVNYLNYKASLGLGIDYPVSKKVAFSLEPSFNYSLNSISTSKIIKPLSMGVFTGVSYFFN